MKESVPRQHGLDDLLVFHLGLDFSLVHYNFQNVHYWLWMISKVWIFWYLTMNLIANIGIVWNLEEKER